MKTLQQVESRIPISSLPFTITNRGSYYITTNLFGPFGQNSIFVNSDDVTVDLNGFTLVGPGVADAITCPVGAANLVVRNGILRPWGSGIDTTGNLRSQVENVLVTQSGGGILVGAHSIVRNCRVINCAAGIYLETRSMAKDCISNSNSNYGFSTSTRGVVQDCLANNNKSFGITAFADSLVTGNHVCGKPGNHDKRVGQYRFLITERLL